jgi:hypothetical protein
MTDKTIADVMEAIEEQQRSLAEHPFMRALDASADVEELRRFAPMLYFYVFAFQDMLRLSHEGIEDPHLREIAGRHRQEDSGHERWFAADMVELGCVHDVVWIFDAHHRVTRDLAYSILAETLGAGDDRLRLTVPLVLEAVGATFFGRVNGLLERAGFDRPLKYFARSHEQVESDHDMFTDAGAQAIGSIPLDDACHRAALGLVQRCFAHFHRLATHLHETRLARAG